MKPLRAFRYWLWGNRLAKTGIVDLQEDQVKEHRALVQEVKKNRSMMLHEMADVVIRLEAVSDNLETALDRLKSDGDEPRCDGDKLRGDGDADSLGR